jgi:hypothetical protein
VHRRPRPSALGVTSSRPWTRCGTGSCLGTPSP